VFGLIVALIGCGKINLTVEMHGSSQAIAQTSIKIFRDGAIHASYTGEQLWYEAGAPSGSYFVRAFYAGDSSTSPTLEVKPPGLFQNREARFDVTLPGQLLRAPFGGITATESQ